MEKYPFFDPYSYMSKKEQNNNYNKDVNKNIINNNDNFIFKEDNIEEEILKTNPNISMKEYFEIKYFYYRYLNEALKYKEAIGAPKINNIKNT